MLENFSAPVADRWGGLAVLRDVAAGSGPRVGGQRRDVGFDFLYNEGALSRPGLDQAERMSRLIASRTVFRDAL